MIKAINGTVGVFKNNQIETKTRESAPFELNTQREHELVASGIAQYCQVKSNKKNAAPMSATVTDNENDDNDMPELGAAAPIGRA